MGLNGRIEPNYFLYRDGSFLAGKKSCFFGSPGCVRLLRAARDRFYDKKIDFYDKKTDFRPETRESSETTQESWPSRTRPLAGSYSKNPSNMENPDSEPDGPGWIPASRLDPTTKQISFFNSILFSVNSLTYSLKPFTCDSILFMKLFS